MTTPDTEGVSERSEVNEQKRVWPTIGRERARELALDQADDVEIIAHLKEEFPPPRYTRANMRERHRACERLVRKMADELERIRIIGQRRIVSCLFEVMDGNPGIDANGRSVRVVTRDSLTAALHLAKEYMGHGGSIETLASKMAKELKRMSPAEQKEFIAAQLAGLRGDGADSLGGGSG